MKKIRWTTQNEAADADGFLLEGAAPFAAECALLKNAAVPAPARPVLGSVEVVDRDESVTTAEVSKAMGRWDQCATFGTGSTRDGEYREQGSR
jgi:hypothetical protein